MEDVKQIWVIEQYHMLRGDENGIWHNDGTLFADSSKDKAIEDIIRLQQNADEAKDETFLIFKYEYRKIDLF